jgi:hypothetical protein
MAVVYDPVKVFSEMPRAVDGWCDGLWNDITAERDTIIREAKGLADEAAEKLSTLLPEELHRYVSDYDVMTMCVALALEALEGWDVAVEQAAYLIENDVQQRAYYDMLRG